MKKVVITGGHLTPAIALIKELQKEKDIKIIFFGRKFSTEGSSNPSAEFKEVNDLGVEFIPLTAGRLPRRIGKYTFLSIIKIPVGFLQSGYYLLKIRPSCVVAFGGYLSFPVVFSAWLLGISSIIHEQASKPGLSNRLSAIFSEKVFLTWQQTKKYLKNGQVVGNLTRDEIFNKEPKDKKLAGILKNAGNLIFITGGNQGSHFLNRFVFENLNLFKDFQIIHQVGTANFNKDHEKASKIQAKNYFHRDFISTSDIGSVFDKAHLIISRSGANTVWDIAILGKNAIFVPLPHSAGNEQEENAKILENNGTSIVISQKEFTKEDLKAKLEDFEKNFTKRKSNAKKLQSELPLSAAQKLTSYIKSR